MELPSIPRWRIWREWKKPSMPVLCTVLPVSPTYFTTIALLAAQPGVSTSKTKQIRQTFFTHGPGLPFPVISKLKPEYARLSDDGLLKKCLHGKTQNQNEALNGMVWQRTPKEFYVGREILESGLYDAVVYLKMGNSTVLKLFDALGIPPGKFTEAECQQLDPTRIHLEQGKSQVNTKRKFLRGERKRNGDKRNQAEGLNYASGQF